MPEDDPLAQRQALEDRVEDELERLKKILSGAWREHPAFVQAFADRLTVETLTGDPSRERRRVYQSLVNFLENAIDEREDADQARERKRSGRRSYLQRLLRDDD